MDRLFHKQSQFFVLGISLLLTMLLLGGCSDKETQVQEELSEAETTLMFINLLTTVHLHILRIHSVNLNQRRVICTTL